MNYDFSFKYTIYHKLLSLNELKGGLEIMKNSWYFFTYQDISNISNN